MKRRILNLVESNPQGMSLKEVSTVISSLSIRQLQRIIGALIDEGKVQSIGGARATIYRPVFTGLEPYDLSWAAESKAVYGGHSIVLSDAAEQLLNLINQPLNQRVEIGYQAEFLKSYKPNEDAYLTVADLEELGKWSSTSLNIPPGTYERDILNRLLIDLSWNSSRLEGNTYSLLDTQRLILKGQFADQKSVLEAQMILNHKEAIEFLIQGQHAVDEESNNTVGYNAYSFLNLHAILANNLLADIKSPGRLRQMPIGITGSKYRPLAIPPLVEEYFNLLLEKADAIKNPFEQAFFLMVHIPYLQPFDDVNKRVSRLGANLPFIKHRLSPLSFIDVPEHLYAKGMLGVYEFNDVSLLKDIFIWAYMRSAQQYAQVRQTIQEPDPFKLKYRLKIKDLIHRIMISALGMAEAQAQILLVASDLTEDDQKAFIHAVELELMALHEGNFARYQVSPSEFQRWKKAWEG